MSPTSDQQYSWKASGTNPQVITRPLTSFEQFFAFLNDTAFNQNCPFIGATISIKDSISEPNQHNFSVTDLQSRAELAFQQTRWKYPMLGCKVVEGREMAYSAENLVEVQSWAKRTVHVNSNIGGWLTLREKVSRDSTMPSQQGDCCLAYIVYPPNAISSGLKTFDVLIHFHHSLTDGAGIRTVLNEFLARLANPLLSETVIWGDEIDRLYPAAVDLATEEERKAAIADVPKPATESTFRWLSNPGHGLPLYRPDILAPKAENKGSSVLSHTFKTPDVLHNLLRNARAHNAKLAAVLQATLFRVIYEFADTKPDPASGYSAITPIDIRNGGRMIAPYAERNSYVFNAAATEDIKVNAGLLQNALKGDGFWELVNSLSIQFAEIPKKKGLGGIQDNNMKSFFTKLSSETIGEQKGGPGRPQTCPYFVSDPPGSNQLDGTYPLYGRSDVELVLESYQLGTDQNQAIVSARSHSWNDKLTICLIFNAIRVPKVEMEHILARWVEIIEMLAN